MEKLNALEGVQKQHLKSLLRGVVWILHGLKHDFLGQWLESQSNQQLKAFLRIVYLCAENFKLTEPNLSPEDKVQQNFFTD